MTYLLDTSVIIALLRKKEEIIDFIASHTDDEIITSTICEAEITTGVYRSTKKDTHKKEVSEVFDSFYKVVVFDRLQADIAGKVKAELTLRGEQIDDMDILIAAASQSQNATLVTYNLRHFQRIKNLSIFDFKSSREKTLLT